MTNNQLLYQQILETSRANRAKEIENERSNRAQELELNRSNLVKEAEIERHNKKEERTKSGELANKWVNTSLNFVSNLADTAAKVFTDASKASALGNFIPLI